MRAERRLAALRGAGLNFDLQPPDRYTPERGWHADALSQPLPGEAPGEPAPGGAWEIARRLTEAYAMADPALVRATWDPAAPLLGNSSPGLSMFVAIRTISFSAITSRAVCRVRLRPTFGTCVKIGLVSMIPAH